MPQVDEFRATLTNEEQKLGADIIKKALPYPLRLIANNAGVNGCARCRAACFQLVYPYCVPVVSYSAAWAAVSARTHSL